MLFNANDNNFSPISRNNYEEYFLLYVDDELNTQERLAVENFLAANSDLQAEMEILLSTKLSAESVELPGKQQLFSDAINLTTIDESLLLYIDKELDGEEIEKIEQQLAKDNAFQLQHAALLQTKLDPLEFIPYPNKKELYRRREKRMVPYWLRIAAAVLITAGTTFWFYTRQSAVSDSGIAVAPAGNTNHSNQPAIAKPVTKETPVVTEMTTASKTKESKVLNEQPVRKLAEEKTRVNSFKDLVKESRKEEKKKEITLSQPEQEKELAIKVDLKKKPDLTNNLPVVEQTPKQTLNSPVVTSPSVASYNPTEASPKTAEQREFLAEVDNEKKSSLKGFLRKATRFIERRTNIKATNENDELLIGAVALKL